ncbi:MAG TPA: lamin tail domain-containing protein, partial [Bacillota bacterium]|nr:lamin tail domain-containing protein [Bacillota bacterium]
MKRFAPSGLCCALISVLVLVASARADTSLVFNEIMYHPATNEPTLEWVELYNQMAVDVDISGWSVDGGIHYTFGPDTIVRGGGYLVVALSPQQLAAATGLPNILGPFSGRLANGGNQLKLLNNNGRLVNAVDYGVDGDWPVAPDGSGVSLAKRDPEAPNSPAANWTFSEQVGGTPGQENFPGSGSSLFLAFNELSAATNAEFWFELINYGAADRFLDGYVLVRDGSTNNQYIFPSSTSLSPGSYRVVTSTTLGFHPQAGDKLYLFTPNRAKVVDAVLVRNTARGRWPEGQGPWLSPSTFTPGQGNVFVFHDEIVINEIMYHHQLLPATNNLLPQPSDEAWVELYNRSSQPVNLSGWKLDGGISYHFAAGQVLKANSYLVVAKDAAALRALYPGVDLVGNISGQLSHNGETIVLEDPAGNPANRVHYYTAGRWPAYADGGGSSLELRDPNADNSRPEAWAASDESSKASWQTYRYQAVADTLVGPELWNDFLFGLLSGGECLIDDISVVESPTTQPVQFVANGNFEQGLTGWRLLGNHSQSRVELDPNNSANHVLHVVATGAQEHMDNHIETTFTNKRKVTDGRVYEISFRAKWRAGNNLLNTRLYFDRVAQTTALATPQLNGTPGARNSRYVSNMGPTFSQFQHRATVPQPKESVTVSVVAQDPQGVDSCVVWWATNGGAFFHATMLPQGGGLFTGTLPGYPAGTLVQFYVQAVDELGAVATYPAGGQASGAFYRVADGKANLSLGHNFRLLLTPANWALLRASTNLMSNATLPCTLIYDEQRAYYDLGVRLKGSLMGRYNDTRPSFHVEFQPDDLFRGVHPVLLLDCSGRPGSANQQEEIVVHHMILHAGGIPFPQPDLGQVIPPFETATGPAVILPRHEDEFLETAYDHGGQGNMWLMEMIYYMTTTNQYGYKLPQSPSLMGVDIEDLGDDKETYRYNFILRNHHSADDYSRFIPFAKTLDLPSGPLLEAQTKQVMDVDEWLRVFAMVSLSGENDWYTFGNNHNFIMYERPSDHKLLAFPWDVEQLFRRSSTSPLIGNQNWSVVANLPANKRRLYAHVLDIIDSTYNTDYMTYWVSHYSSFAPGQNFSDLLTYIQQRTSAVLSEINYAGGNSSFTLSRTS